MFDMKEYDRQFFEPHMKAFENLDVEISMVDSKLNNETKHLIHGFNILCLFVHDDATDPNLIDYFAKNGVELIVLRSAGYDYIHLNECKKNNIPVLHVPSYSPNSISEFALGMIFSLCRHLPYSYQRTKNGDFTLQNRLLGFECERGYLSNDLILL